VPDALAVDDHLDQHALTDLLRESAFTNQASKAAYKALPYQEVSLNTMKRIYEEQNSRWGYSLLRKRTKINVGDLRYPQNDPMLAFDLRTHFLDFMLCVSNDVGFDALLPNLINDLNFHFDLDLHQPHRQFSFKHAEIGLDGSNRMLYIGRVRGKDLAWLIMAPNSYFHETPAAMLASHANPLKSSALPVNHYWMMVMCFAHFYAKTFPTGAVYCSDSYPDLTIHAGDHVNGVTNIL